MAGWMDGAEISIKNEGSHTFVTVKLYPYIATIKMDRYKDSYEDMMDRIKEMLLLCHSNRNVQF